jgi:hypothetical protein
MEVIENLNMCRVTLFFWPGRANNHSGGFVFVEITIVTSIAEGVLGPIEGFPKVGSDWPWGHNWWHFQNKRFNLRPRRQVNGDDDPA